MDKCRGQGYDGAGSMAGRVKGVAARISVIYKFAVYTHCFSHALNLSVMRIINVKYVKEMFDNCKVIFEFFNNSPKRYELFSTILKQTVPDATTSTKLINICRTRWVERSKGIQRFKECYKATVLCMLTRLVIITDEVITDLEGRFDPEKMSLISGFYCIPVIMQKYPHWKSKVREFMQKYTKDMVCIHSCDAELDLWATLWFKENITSYPGTVQGTLSNKMTGMFPNIHRVLILLGVSPVTTCSCERSISVQRRLKTYLRSTMVQDRYNALALIQIHYGMDIDHHDVLDRLNRKYPKRLLMVNVLGE